MEQALSISGNVFSVKAWMTIYKRSEITPFVQISILEGVNKQGLINSRFD